MGGLRGVWHPLLEIGRNSPFSCPLAVFRMAQTTHGKSRARSKLDFSQISSDLLKPPALKHQACRSVFVKFLVKFDLEFDLKFEISDGKNLVKFRAGLNSTCQESTGNFGAIFGANFGENFGNFVSNFATFFGNFVQQKGGANNCGTPLCTQLRMQIQRTSPHHLGKIFTGAHKSGEGAGSLKNPPWKYRPFQSWLEPSQGLLGDDRDQFLCTSQLQETPFGPSPSLLSPCLDFADHLKPMPCVLVTLRSRRPARKWVSGFGSN